MSDLPAYVLYRGLSGAFGLLPEPAVRAVGRGLGWSLSHVARDRMALVERHMRRVLGPNASPEEIEAAAREVFASYGRYWAEVFWFRARRKSEVADRAEVLGLEPVYAARDAGRGIIFALPHLGNWDVAGAVAEKVHLPVLAVAERLPNALITEWFYDTRRALGIEVVLAGDENTTKDLIRHLKNGGVVALVSDRDVTGRGVDVEFFGERTTMPAGPVALADRTGAAIFPVAPLFADGAGYEMVIYPELVIPPADTRAERIQAGTQEYARRLEDIIRSSPTQWHVLVPNWPSDREWQATRR